MNTWFTKHPKYLWTWKSPDSQTKNQIDYITIKSRFRNCIQNIRTFPGADCSSTDHALLVCGIKVMLQKVKRKILEPKLDFKVLQKQHTKVVFKELVVETQGHPVNEQDANKRFQQLQQSLKAVARKAILRQPRNKHKPWITTEILKLMEKRRKIKNNKIEYSKIDKEIKKACQKAKDKHLNELCAIIEDLEKKNPRLIHEEIKETANRRNICSAASCVESKDGTITKEK